MTRISPLLERNEQFARTHIPVPLGLPTAQMLIVSCLDHRVDPAIVRPPHHHRGRPVPTVASSALPRGPAVGPHP